jgi:transposase-like protein
MSSVLRVSKDRKIKPVRAAKAAAGRVAPADLETKVALIQTLIPLGLQAVAEVLEAEVAALAGPRYARQDGAPHLVRWGRQGGAVYLADQKVPVAVPRVRNRQTGTEVSLQAYAGLQQPRAADEGVLRRILYGLSCRDYRACAEAVPEAFGLSRSSISRRYVYATARKLQALQERRLDRDEFVALILDGKTFAEDTMVIALGITVRGEKVLLGFVQTGTENAAVCAAFLRRLVERGLRVGEGLLVVLDGSKGLRRAVQDVLGERAQVQRCTYHKRENVVAYLPQRLQAVWRAKLQHAYRHPTYTAAQDALHRLHQELRRLNEDAAHSLAEGLEETLTLHRLGVAAPLGQHFQTTNMLESILAQVEQRTGKVDRWTTSEQKHRWLATVLLDIEPRLRRVRGYRYLSQLQAALQQAITKEKEVRVA